MPRLNIGRSVNAESNLARRIAYEREQRSQSYEALADLMTKAGCAIAGSSIFKIEKGNPPRRVSVDELVTLAQVWDLSVEDLLTPMELLEQKRALELLQSLQATRRGLAELAGQLFNDFVDLAVVHREHPEIYEYVMGHFRLHPMGELPESVDNEEGDGADEVLMYLLSDVAGRFWHAVSAVTVMYLETLEGMERGEGPTEDDLKAWVAEWAESGTRFPERGEATAKLISRVEDWTERLRASNGEHQEAR